MNKERKKYIKSCEISEIVRFNLGGYDQYVLIEGKSASLPVVICLHGGPGSPVPFGVGCRGLFPEWTSKAIMVFWDQLGCGKNNRKLDDGFTIESFVKMTEDLIREIKARFPVNKLYLFAVSWGSILSLKTAVRVPALLDGVFVYGQLLKNNFFSEEVVQAFGKAPKKVKAKVAEIAETGAGCDYEILDGNLKKLYKYLSKYTDAYYNRNAKPIKIGAIVKGLITSPDYSLKDFKAVMNNGYKYNQSLWREILGMDLYPLLAEIGIPYYILQGETDIVTSTRSVCRGVYECGNKNVSATVIEKSGHMPSEQAMTDVFKMLCAIIK